MPIEEKKSNITPAQLKLVLQKLKGADVSNPTAGINAQDLAKLTGSLSNLTEVQLSKAGMHKTWKNQIANQVVEPLYYFKPDTMLRSGYEDTTTIVGILQKALSTGNKVKAAGSGHSYSDVATTPDFFIDTHSFNKISSKNKPIEGQLSQDMLKPGSLPLAVDKMKWADYNPEKNRALFETEAGITIKDLNTALCSREVGMINMGGYDGQTIMGAISTSTHGSGITLPPFPDLLRSLVLVTTGKWNGKTFGGGANHNGVYMYRIEPSNGITDPTKYKDYNIELIQDDDCFKSVICSMGCMGVVYSIVIEVMQKYWLSETRSMTTLDKVMEMLSSPAGQDGALPTALQQIRNLEVLVHPYPMKGWDVIEMDPNQPAETYYPYFKCLVTQRKIVPVGTKEPDSKPRNFFIQLLSKLDLSFELTVDLLNAFPTLTPAIINTAMSGLVDYKYDNVYWKIYDLGLNGDAGFAAEIGFPLENSNGGYTKDYFKAAVDRIHKIAQNARINGHQYQTSPFSLRFVKSSDAHLSMMQGMNTCMIEMDMVTGTYGGPEIMMRYQNNMYDLGGRPHWGLEFDNLSGANNFIGQMYPKLDKWMAVYNQFNGLGTFNNKFTDRMGFTKHKFVRSLDSGKVNTNTIYQLQAQRKAEIEKVLSQFRGKPEWETARKSFHEIIKNYIHGGSKNMSEAELDQHFERALVTTQDDVKAFSNLTTDLLKSQPDASSPYYIVNVGHHRNDAFFATNQTCPITGTGTGKQKLDARFDAQNLYQRYAINATSTLPPRVKLTPLPDWATIAKAMTDRASFDKTFCLTDKTQADAVFAITSKLDWNTVQGDLFMTPDLFDGAVFAPALYSVYFFGANGSADKNIFVFVTADGQGHPLEPFVGLVTPTGKPDVIYSSINRFPFSYLSSAQNPAKYSMVINKSNLQDYTLNIQTYFPSHLDSPYISVHANFTAQVSPQQVAHFKDTPGLTTILLLQKGTLMKDLVKAYFPNSTSAQLWEDIDALTGKCGLANALAAIGLDILSGIFACHVWEEKPTIVG